MAQVVPFMIIAVVPHSMLAGLEGVLIASRDQFFHSMAYLIFGAIFISSQVCLEMKHCVEFCQDFLIFVQ